jgi:hypothetical protein
MGDLIACVNLNGHAANLTAITFRPVLERVHPALLSQHTPKACFSRNPYLKETSESCHVIRNVMWYWIYKYPAAATVDVSLTSTNNFQTDAHPKWPLTNLQKISRSPTK